MKQSARIRLVTQQFLSMCTPRRSTWCARKMHCDTECMSMDLLGVSSCAQGFVVMYTTVHILHTTKTKESTIQKCPVQ